MPASAGARMIEKGDDDVVFAIVVHVTTGDTQRAMKEGALQGGIIRSAANGLKAHEREAASLGRGLRVPWMIFVEIDLEVVDLRAGVVGKRDDPNICCAVAVEVPGSDRKHARIARSARLSCWPCHGRRVLIFRGYAMGPPGSPMILALAVAWPGVHGIIDHRQRHLCKSMRVVVLGHHGNFVVVVAVLINRLIEVACRDGARRIFKRGEANRIQKTGSMTNRCGERERGERHLIRRGRRREAL